MSGEGERGSGAPSTCHAVRGGRACVCHGVAGRGVCPLMHNVRQGHEGSESKALRGTHFLSSLPLPLAPSSQDQSPPSQPPQLPFPLAHPSSLPTLSTPPFLLSLPPFLYPFRSQTQQMCQLNASCPSPGQPPLLQPRSLSHTHTPPFVHLSSSPDSLPVPPSSTPSPFIHSSSPVPSSLHPLPSALPPNSTSYFHSASETLSNQSLSIPALSPPPSATTSPRRSKFLAAATSHPPPRTTPNGNNWCGGNEKEQPRKVTGKGKRRGITEPGTAPYTATTIRTTNSTKAGIPWFKKVVVFLFPLFSIAAASYKLKRKYYRCFLSDREGRVMGEVTLISCIYVTRESDCGFRSLRSEKR